MVVTIRQVMIQDLDSCFKVEYACYTNEGASRARIKKRIEEFSQGFFVAEVDGKIVGIINGTSTNKEDMSDEDLKDMVGFDLKGKRMIIFSLAVHPDYQGKGISKPLLLRYIEASKEMGKEKILLICKKELISYYEKFGFELIGKSKSTHGGFEWFEMELVL